MIISPSGCVSFCDELVPQESVAEAGCCSLRSEQPNLLFRPGEADYSPSAMAIQWTGPQKFLGHPASSPAELAKQMARVLVVEKSELVRGEVTRPAHALANYSEISPWGMIWD